MAKYSMKCLLLQLDGTRETVLADLALRGPHRLTAKERTYMQGRLIQLNQTMAVIKFMIEKNTGLPVSMETLGLKKTQ